MYYSQCVFDKTKINNVVQNILSNIDRATYMCHDPHHKLLYYLRWGSTYL